MYTVMYSVCKHNRPNQWDTEDQYTGTKCTYKGPIIWAYGDTMHVQKNNPIGTRGTCVYKGPTQQGSDAQIEDQSYEHMHDARTVVQSYGMLHVATGVVHKNMPYDGVQVYIRNNSSVCTSAGDCVSQHGYMFMYYA